MPTLLSVFAVLLFLWTVMPFVRIPAPLGFAVLFPRATGAALSPYLSVAGAVGALAAFWFGAFVAMGLFGIAFVFAMVTAARIMTTHGDFGAAFGPDWHRAIAPAMQRRMLRRRWLWKMPTAPQASWQRDVPFWTIPESSRTLLCDVWQPPAGVQPSGLAYIYLHGSAWYILDKDAYTRRFFRHLAAQGHVVMDVAYRLYPETDVPGMVGDAKRAIAWLKAHAAEYGVNPERVVIGGSSAGGHMAQLVGFAPHHSDLTPEDVRDLDLSVRGIISCYGPSDMGACFRHTNQHRIPGVGVTPPDMALLTSAAPAGLVKVFGKDSARMGYQKMPVAGRLDWLMGGTPEQAPRLYSLCSPINHVHPACPPTLLIQGEDDLITSAAATRQLEQRLQAASVPVINVIYPHTDHMFDLMLLSRSPSAQGATYDIERFLAVLAA